MSTAAIIGSRRWEDFDAFCEQLPDLGRFDTIISGGAKGVDAMALMIAATLGKRFVEYPTARRAGESFTQAAHARNQLIVDALDGAGDILIAFPGPRSRGTWDTVRRARAKGIPVIMRKAAK